MPQHPIEIILLKQWAGYIAIPTWIADAEGNLVYYNEPAETILGVRFDEAGPMPASTLAEQFVTTSLDGEPVPTEELPLVIALQKRIPAHLPLRIKAFDGSWRNIEVTALPIEGQGGTILGAMASFWEMDS